MTTREKEKIKVLFNETMALAEDNKEFLTGLDNDCEEINVACLTIDDVKMLLENLKTNLLKEDE